MSQDISEEEAERAEQPEDRKECCEILSSEDGTTFELHMFKLVNIPAGFGSSSEVTHVPVPIVLMKFTVL